MQSHITPSALIINLGVYLLMLSSTIVAQTYPLTVTNGYGSGMYAAGDTVNIFSRELDYVEAFQGWDYSPNNLEWIRDEGEWRAQFIMPEQPVAISADIVALPTDFLEFVELSINEVTKPVYFAFPENPLGTVLLLHGTGGSVDGWIGTNREQNFSILKELYAAGFGVLVIESRESSLGIDLNEDGKIRWLSYPINLNTNIEYQDVNETLNYFIDNEGLDPDELYAIGMSAGGSFAGTVAQAFQARAAVIYGATSQAVLVNTTQIPIQYCMMENDAILDPGSNALAATYSQALNDRGVCSRYYLHRGYPIYPAYFRRVGLDLTTSEALFLELEGNGWLDAADFLLGTVGELQNAFQSDPNQWPTIASLSGAERIAIGNLLATAGAEHQFFSLHNQRTIDFLVEACGDNPSSTYSGGELAGSIQLFPNPTSGEIWLETAEVEGQFTVFDTHGRQIRNGIYQQGQTLDLGLSTGMYLLVFKGQESYAPLRFVVH